MYSWSPMVAGPRLCVSSNEGIDRIANGAFWQNRRRAYSSRTDAFSPLFSVKACFQPAKTPVDYKREPLSVGNAAQRWCVAA